MSDKFDAKTKDLSNISELRDQFSSPYFTISLIVEIPELSNEQILKLLKRTYKISRDWFLVSGAVTSEIKTRFDNADEFINEKSRMHKGWHTFLTNELELDSILLNRDYLINEEFGDYLKNLLMESPEKILPSEFYAEAVKSNKPLELLKFYEVEFAKGDYDLSRARFARRFFNQGLSFLQIRLEDAEFVKSRQNR